MGAVAVLLVDLVRLFDKDVQPRADLIHPQARRGIREHGTPGKGEGRDRQGRLEKGIPQ